MKMTIDCPKCEMENAVDAASEKSFRCSNCQSKFEIDWDFEFVDGAWSNNTRVKEVIKISFDKLLLKS